MGNSPTHLTLITGATSGIGYELAKLFARDHHDLVLVARNAEKLAQIVRDFEAHYGIRVRVMVRDLAAPSAAREIFEELQRDGLTVDTLVNNAGFGVFGLFAETDLQKNLDLLAVNLTSLTELTGLFLPPMLKAGRGRILNVASTAGFQPGPLMSVYYASKAYVVSFSEALAEEVKSGGVTVSCLCPGPTETQFQQHAGMERSKLFEHAMIDAATVAEVGYRGMRRGKTLIIPGFRNKLLVQVVRFTPRRLIPRVVRSMQEQRRKHT
ncbi:MAG TPA: SDR family oxidoreductase [bacterium]|jgi:hypothetical protein